jgi:Transglycosylase SLT domain
MNGQMRDGSKGIVGAGTSRRTLLIGIAGAVAGAASLRGLRGAKAASAEVNWDVLQWSDQILGASAWSGVPAHLLAGMIDVESGGDRWFVSEAGALGLMQILPWWFDELGVDLDRWSEPDVSAEVGSTILARMTGGSDDWASALAGYFGHGCDAYGTCTDDYVAMVIARADVYAGHF